MSAIMFSMQTCNISVVRSYTAYDTMVVDVKIAARTPV